MKCRSCGKDVAEGAGRRVAEWTFCEACFDALLEPRRAAAPAPRETPPAKPKPVEAAPSAPVAPSAGAAKASCALCQAAMEGDGGLQLGSMRLCEACTQSLMAMPAADDEAGAPPSGGSTAVPDILNEPVAVPWVDCAGCGRRIQSRASKAHEGQPYCPDCFHALPPPPKSPPAPSPSPAAPATAASDGGECDSCGRTAPVEATAATFGFRLCRACLETDGTLALQLARARHRRRMEALRAELLE